MRSGCDPPQRASTWRTWRGMRPRRAEYTVCFAGIRCDDAQPPGGVRAPRSCRTCLSRPLRALSSGLTGFRAASAAAGRATRAAAVGRLGARRRRGPGLLARERACRLCLAGATAARPRRGRRESGARGAGGSIDGPGAARQRGGLAPGGAPRRRAGARVRRPRTGARSYAWARAATVSRAASGWSRMPESLSVPATIGLVDLRLDGRALVAPRRDGGGLLWLRSSAHADDGTAGGDSVRLQVFRHIVDGVPLFVETRLQLEVAGKSREIALEGALLPGSVPLEVGGDLPARVENGSLRVQVRGGRYTVSLRARVEGQPKLLTRPREEPAAPWPAREVWVFEADETLRQVELSGPPPIDPSRTELPSEWQRLPAFLVDPGASLALQEVRRGQAAPPPDDIRLGRVLWLDPDGRGATVHDDFTGTLHGTTRVDVLPPAQLGRVAARRPGPARHDQPGHEGDGRRVAPASARAGGRLEARAGRRAARRGLDDRGRAAAAHRQRATRLEPVRGARRRPGDRRLGLALDAARLLPRPRHHLRRAAGCSARAPPCSPPSRSCCCTASLVRRSSSG